MKPNAHIRQNGHAVVEIALMAPWLFLLFVGIFDFGFYAYAAISVENAARAAAIYTSSTNGLADSNGACTYALQELQNIPNVGGLSSCNALPLIVTAAADNSVGGEAGTKVTVTYQSIPLIPIPWMPGTYNITRSVWMRGAE